MRIGINTELDVGVGQHPPDDNDRDNLAFEEQLTVPPCGRAQRTWRAQERMCLGAIALPFGAAEHLEVVVELDGEPQRLGPAVAMVLEHAAPPAVTSVHAAVRFEPPVAITPEQAPFCALPGRCRPSWRSQRLGRALGPAARLRPLQGQRWIASRSSHSLSTTARTRESAVMSLDSRTFRWERLDFTDHVVMIAPPAARRAVAGMVMPVHPWWADGQSPRRSTTR